MGSTADARVTHGGVGNRRLRAVLATLVVLAVVAACGSAFAVAYLDRPAVERSPLIALLGLRDGAATLYRVQGPDGRAWESVSIRVVPGVPALATTEPVLREAMNHYLDPVHDDPGVGVLDRIQVQREVFARLQPDGSVKVSEATTLLGPEGYVQVGLKQDGAAQPAVFDPPLPLLPSRPRPGSTWHEDGRVAGQPYRQTGRVTEIGDVTAAGIRYRGCITSDTRLTIPGSVARYRSTACPGFGIVRTVREDEKGTEVEVRVPDGASRAGVPSVRSKVEPLRLAPSPRLRLDLVGQAQGVQTVIPHASSPPVWVPGDPSMLVVADEASGDVIAVDTDQQAGQVVWRFHPSNPSYSGITYDPARGRLYFGAGDGRVYALDRRGVFLWSAQTGDNVASRPVVSGDQVIAGSEDGSVRAFDAVSGRTRWRAKTGDALVSDPAVVGSTVVIGSDSGSVYGFDAGTGEQRWQWDAGGGVQAGVTRVPGGHVAVAARSGTVAVLDAASGTVRWTAQARADVLVTPTLAGTTVVAVDDLGEATAFDLDDGSVSWRRQSDYTGSAIAAGDRVVLSGEGGTVDVLGPTGDRVRTFDAGESSPAGAVRFRFSPAAGEDAVWFVADDTRVFSLGGVRRAARLELAWVDPVSDHPLAARPVVTTPVGHQGALYLIDADLAVARVDPATGKGKPIGSIDAGPDARAIVDPVVVEDLLVADLGSRLVAVHLPDLRVRWSVAADPNDAFTPAVLDGMAVFSDAGSLRAIDLGSGEQRWRVAAGTSSAGSGVVAGPDHTVVGGAPLAAFDAADGVLRWRSEVAEPAGSAVVRGDTVFAVANPPDASHGTAYGLQATTGKIRFERALPEGAAQDPYDRLVVEGGTLVVSGFDRLVGVDAKDGTLRWEQRPGNALAGTTTVADGRAYHLLQNSQVIAIDVETGKVATTAGFGLDLSTRSLAQRPFVDDDVVVVAMGDVVVGFRKGPS